jgi:LPXTG-motif cell wall-anchored protein
VHQGGGDHGDAPHAVSPDRLANTGFSDAVGWLVGGGAAMLVLGAIGIAYTRKARTPAIETGRPHERE